MPAWAWLWFGLFALAAAARTFPSPQVERAALFTSLCALIGYWQQVGQTQ